MSNPVSSSPPLISVPVNRPPFTGTSSGNGYYVSICVAPGTAVSGAVHPCLVDTGSCGIVVPLSVLCDAHGILLPGVVQGDAITIPYEPSSEDLTGFKYKVHRLGVGLNQVDGTTWSFVCEDVEVVGVTNAKPGEGMMGVGFGRPNPFGSNVLLSAPGVNPSYLLTPEGITLGYTAATLPEGYVFESLTKGAIDWQTPAATLTLGSTAYPGTALIDTGINTMMIGFDAPNWEQTFIGQQVQISWPGGSATPILSYAFTITGPYQAPISDSGKPRKAYTTSASSNMVPEYVLSIGQSPDAPAGNFVNTGINVIQGANYFYDSVAGQIGFQLKLPNS
jgi:hypothetical protein